MGVVFRNGGSGSGGAGAGYSPRLRGPGYALPYASDRRWHSIRGGSPAARFFSLKRQHVPKSSYYPTGIGEKAIKGGGPAANVLRSR